MAMDWEKIWSESDQECRDCWADCWDCPFQGIVAYDRGGFAEKARRVLWADGMLVKSEPSQ